MSKIDILIKQLQEKKKKIDYISYISDVLKNDKHCIDFSDVKDEVLSQIEPLLLKLMDSIENDVPMSLGEDAPTLDPDEVKILKILVLKAQQKATEVVEQAPQEPRTPAKPKPVSTVSNQDKLSFAMDNRHLANRKVQVINDQNVSIVGLVVGLDAPHVHVKTETGPTIQVPLEKVVLV